MIKEIFEISNRLFDRISKGYGTTIVILTRAIGLFIFGVVFYFTCLLVRWQFFPYNIAEAQQPISIENIDDRVNPGEIIHMTLVVDKESNYRAESIDVYAECDNGELYGLERVTGAERLREGSYIRERQFRLEERTPAGLLCIGIFDLRYDVNPIREVNMVWQTEPFETI